MEIQETLLDAIYAAALDEISWESAIIEFNKNFMSPVGGFFIQDILHESFNEIVLTGFEESAISDYKNHYGKINPWFTTPDLVKPNRILTETELDIAHNKIGTVFKTEYFHDWLRPNNLHYTIGVCLNTRGSINFNFTMLRPAEIGAYTNTEIEALNRLNKHLRRAMEINQIIKRAKTYDKLLLSSLDKLGIGVALLGEDSSIIELNSNAELIFKNEDGVNIKNRRIFVTHKKAHNTLQNTIETLNFYDLNITASEWIKIPRPSGRPDYQLIIMQSRNSMNILNEPYAKTTLIIIDPSKRNFCSTELLQRHFLFTKKEADVAQCLLMGMAAKQISGQLELTYESTRWYIKQLRKKVGARSQADFISRILSHTALLI